MNSINEALKPDNIYHIYNHANGNENLFHNDENYLYFLKLFFEFISPIADVYSYCLLPNHFHFLLKIKSEKTVFTYFKIEGKFPDETMTLEELKKLSTSDGLQNLDILSIHLSRQFSNFFNAYAKAVNKQLSRRGSLLERAFKRVEMKDNNQLMECISYIHTNPIKHNFTKEITTWKYNSYNAIVSDKPTKLMREEVIDIFENKEYFLDFHREKMKKYL
jgi:putative transposase